MSGCSIVFNHKETEKIMKKAKVDNNYKVINN
jgi:hypothetical protein